MKKTTVILRKRYLKREKRWKMFRLCVMILMGVLSAAILSAVFTSDASEDSGRIKYYTSVEIAPGESLWTVCEQYRSSEYADRQSYMLELCRLNHLSDDSAIHAGQHLIVPYYTDIP